MVDIIAAILLIVCVAFLGVMATVGLTSFEEANAMLDCIYSENTITTCEDALGYTHSFKE